jgi:hypothetical protein
MLKVEGIIIEPDPDSRARMKQACFAVPVLSKIESAADFSDVLRRLTKQAETDYTAIFVSYRFSPAQIAEFIKNAKTTELGQDCAFVMVLKNIEQGSQLITDGLQLGADGFLFEPFSVESLANTANLAMEIKNQRRETREKAAVTLLVKDLISHLDLVAERIVRGQEGGPELKYLREFEEKIKNLIDRKKEFYLKTFPKIIAEQNPPLLNLDQEIRSIKSAKMRAHMRLMQKMIERGQEVAPVTPVETNNFNNVTQTPWEEESFVSGTLILTLKIDLYDKPTCDALFCYITDGSQVKKRNIELDLSKTRAFSSYALAKLIAANAEIKKNQGTLSVKNTQGIAQEILKIIGFTDFVRVIS